MSQVFVTIHNIRDCEHAGCIQGCAVAGGEQMYIQDALDANPNAVCCAYCLPNPDGNAHDVIVEEVVI